MATGAATRSARVESVTCPRAILLRKASRTSPSQHARSGGSLMLGLKNRWLTVRTSTLTRVPPIIPSAVPYPVILRIMDNLANYCRTRTSSIEKVPSHAVEIDRARIVESGDLLVRIAERVTELPRQHRVEQPNFEQRRDDPIRVGG